MKAFLFLLFFVFSQSLGKTLLQKSISQAIESVVSIKVEINAHESSSLKKAEHILFPQKTSSSKNIANGTGFFIFNENIILTPFHVVKDSSRIWVKKYNSERNEEAYLYKYDEKADLAFLKTKNKYVKGKPLKMGSSKSLSLGEELFSIGNPLGYEHTVIKAFLSARRSTVEGLSFPPQKEPPFLQFDGAFQRGHSGSPVFNEKGQVIAMAVARDSLGPGIAFGLAMEYIELFTQNWWEEEKFYALGIVFEETKEGLKVSGVYEKSPAWKAGIRRNDFCVHIDYQDCREILWQNLKRDVFMEFSRQGKSFEIKIKPALLTQKQKPLHPLFL